MSPVTEEWLKKVIDVSVGTDERIADDEPLDPSTWLDKVITLSLPENAKPPKPPVSPFDIPSREVGPDFTTLTAAQIKDLYGFDVPTVAPLVRDDAQDAQIDPRQQAIEVLGKPSLFEKTGTFVTAAVRGLATTVAADIPQALGLIQADIVDLFSDDEPLVKDYALFQFGESARKFLAEKLPSDPRLAGGLIDVVGGAVGQTGAFIIPGLAVGKAAQTVGLGLRSARQLAFGTAAIVGGGISGPAHAERARQAALKDGASEEEADELARIAARFGAAVGLMEPVGVPVRSFKILGRLDDASGGKLFGAIKKFAKEVGAGFAHEFLQEGGQQFLDNAVANQIYDKEQRLFEASSIGESAGVGGIVGAIFGMITGAGNIIRRLRGRGQPPLGPDLEPIPPQPQPPPLEPGQQEIPSTPAGLSPEESARLDAIGPAEIQVDGVTTETIVPTSKEELLTPEGAEAFVQSPEARAAVGNLPSAGNVSRSAFGKALAGQGVDAKQFDSAERNAVRDNLKQAAEQQEVVAEAQAAVELGRPVDQAVQQVENAGQESAVLDAPGPTSQTTPQELGPLDKPSKLKDATKEARQEAEQAWQALERFTQGRLFANPLDPQLVRLAAKAVTKSVKANILTFAEFLAEAVNRFGIAVATNMEPAMRKAWENQRKTDVRLDAPVATINQIMQREATPRIIAEVPTDEEIPNANQPTDVPVGDILDQWHADRDEQQQEAEIRALNHQQAIAATVGATRYNKKARQVGEAILLYIDLKGRVDAEVAAHGVPKDAEQRATLERSQNLTPEQVLIAEDIIEENEAIGLLAKEAGVIKVARENYIARILQPPADKSVDERPFFRRRFMIRTSRAKPRTLSSILEAWKLGYTLKVADATIAQLSAASEIAQVINDRNIIKTALKAGVLSRRQEQSDWKQVRHPNFTKTMFTGAVEGAIDETSFGQNAVVTTEGAILERVPLWAEPGLAKKLNNALGTSALNEIRFVHGLTKWNAIIKHTILSTNLFHHFAFLRSFMLGSRGIDPVKAYRQGRQVILNFTPELRDLVRAGLTIGRQQEWDAAIVREKTWIGKVIDRVPMAAEVKDKILRLRDMHTDFLFTKLGANMKVQAALLEQAHFLKKHDAKIEAGEMTRHDVAKAAADNSNNDFGGLNLKRLHRNPTLQHALRLIALAPDWTESNVRSMVKMFNRGLDGEVHRQMWVRIAYRTVLAQVTANLILSAFDDKDFIERYQKAWKEGRMRWLDVDVTPIYRAFGGDNEKRKYFSILGHFRDPIKFVTHTVRSLKHKSSVVGGFLLEMMAGSNWQNRRFTTIPELFGVDDKGTYRSSREGKHRIGDPKGGKLKGKLIHPFEKGRGPLAHPQVPSFLVDQARGALPIQIQAGMTWLAGEMDGFDALTRSLGIITSSTYPGKPRDAVTEAAEAGDSLAARSALQRLVADEAENTTPEAMEKARDKYLGTLVYKLSNPETKKRRGEDAEHFALRKGIRDEDEQGARTILNVLGIDNEEAQKLLHKEWRRRGLRIRKSDGSRSDALTRRAREVSRSIGIKP